MATALNTRMRETEGANPDRSFVGFLKAVKDSTHKDYYRRCMALETLEKAYGSHHNVSPVQTTKTVMGETSGEVGGYLVPQEFSLAIMRTIEESSIVYPRATRVPMGSSTTLLPRLNVETAQSAGVAPYFGGMTFSWGFSEAPTQTEPTFKQNELNAWDLIGYSNVSNNFLMDLGPGGDAYLINLFGKAAAWYSEYAFLRGLGAATSMPLGILNCLGKKSVTRAGSNAIAIADIASMAAALLPYSWTNSIWVCSPPALAQITKVTGYTPNWADPAPGQAGYLLSRPLFVTDKLPNLGTAGDLILFDPSLYTIGVRSEVMIDISTEQLFANNQSQFRTWLRMDGRPEVSGPITMAGDGSTTVSPYVVLN